MASAAEQLAANLNLGVLSKATELKQRIWFTLGALIVYRIGTYIPVPGVDASVMTEMLQQHGGGILGMFDMFTGGALRRMTVFALNIMPYISASIIIQLMTAAVPTLEALKKEGETGRKKLNQYTRYLTVFIAMFQSYGIAVGLESMHGSFGAAVIDPGWFFRFSCVITLVGGTMFLMWIGEQITARGVGNGTIADHHVRHRRQSAERARLAARPRPHRRAVAVLHRAASWCSPLLVIAFIVFIERAQRRIVVQYPEAPGRHADVRRQLDAYAAEDQHLGRDPADLRQFHPADSGDHRRLLGRHGPGWLQIDRAPSCRTGTPLYMAAVRGDDHLLLVFLHRGGVQPGGDRGQPEEIRRVHPGHPAGQRDRRVLRLRADAADHGGRALPGGGLPAAGDPDQRLRAAVLFRRHLDPDRGLGYHGHRDADPVASAGASVRRPDPQGRSEAR